MTKQEQRFAEVVGCLLLGIGCLSVARCDSAKMLPDWTEEPVVSGQPPKCPAAFPEFVRVNAAAGTFMCATAVPK